MVWCVTEQGKRMPIDPMPVKDGNVAVFECPETGTDMCRVLSDAERATWGNMLFKSHFATCPNANQHRSRA
jgi:hypothetical protein